VKQIEEEGSEDTKLTLALFKPFNEGDDGNERLSQAELPSIELTSEDDLFVAVIG
jgi:hypothetical protein